MWKQIVQARYIPFTSKILQVIKGEVPKDINGRLFRNQPSTLVVNQQPLPHWFYGDGSILSLTFNNGSCEASFAHINTPNRQYTNENHKWRPGFIETIFRKLTRRQLNTNPANTSVYPVPNSPLLLALCEGGLPYMLDKKSLDSVGFEHFGIKNGYSAHPKIDPQTKQLYNIGMGKTPKQCHIYKHTENMKLVTTNKIILRDYQTIHDCVIAGDYLIIFECPLAFDLKGLLKGKHTLNCLSYAPQKYNTAVHVFAKSDLKYIGKYDAPSFFMFHFINGEQTQKGLQIQFIKYSDEIAPNALDFFAKVPQIALNKNLEPLIPFHTTVSKITINLEQKDVKIQDFEAQYGSEFPVISDAEVGKKWRYSYHSVSNKGSQNFTKIGIYDRQLRKFSKVFDFGDHTFVSQPVLIQNKQANYLIPIVFDGKQHKCYAVILDAQDLKQICVLQLPEIIPPSFHGRWDYSPLQ